MAFESLTERLQNVFKNLRKKGKISESDVQEATKEIRLALLEADVALPVVKDFIRKFVSVQSGMRSLIPLILRNKLLKSLMRN